jgi:hypothetical protein
MAEVRGRGGPGGHVAQHRAMQLVVVWLWLWLCFVFWLEVRPVYYPFCSIDLTRCVYGPIKSAHAMCFQGAEGSGGTN